MKNMNLPNKLTLLRIAIVPFIIAATLINFKFNFLLAGLLFGAAAITDLLDGKIARRDNLVTDFGKFADPLADKILVISIFVCYVKLGLCGAVPVIILLFREFAVTSIRLVAASNGKVVAANIYGKAKTVSQIVAIIGIYTLRTILDILSLFKWDYIIIYQIFNIIGQIFVWVSTVFAIVSGIKYIIDNKDCIKDM